MNKMKSLIGLALAISLLMIQAGGAFAAPALQEATPIKGTVQRVTLTTDSNTGLTTVTIHVKDQGQAMQIVRISQETAIALALVALDGDGKPVINALALGQSIEIDPATVIPDKEEDRHPVGNALATFFSDVPGLDYDTIMESHNNGVGFGVIAQALWLTIKLDGDSEIFQDLLAAKETGNYAAFTLEDGTTPKNWGQLRNAVLDGKKVADPSAVRPDNNGNGNGNANGQNNNNNSNKEKDKDKDKNNNGGGNGNGNGGGNDPGNGNGEGSGNN